MILVRAATVSRLYACYHRLNRRKTWTAEKLNEGFLLLGPTAAATAATAAAAAAELGRQP